jgi:alpha-galactosidase
MLQVGQVSPNTQEANQAHFGAWAIVSSPLILGMNLSDQAAMDVSWPIVTNKEVSISCHVAAHVD